MLSVRVLFRLENELILRLFGAQFMIKHSINLMVLSLSTILSPTNWSHQSLVQEALAIRRPFRVVELAPLYSF